MTRINISKRIFMLFLVSWITFTSVFSAYQETTYCAEWIGGVIGAIGGAPIMTALLIGGVVVAGGYAIYELSQTTPEDHANFVNGLKEGFQQFVAEQETIIAKEQDSSLTDQEASDIGVANARESVNNFFSNAVEGVGNTTKNLKDKAVAYWQLYSRIIGNVADNGINNGQNITPTTQIVAPVIGGTVTATVMANIGANCIKVNNSYYLQIGQVYLDNIYHIGDTRYNRVPFLLCNTSDGVASAWSYDVENDTFVREAGGSYLFFNGLMNTILQNTNLPILVGNYPNDSWQSFVRQNWQSLFKVGGSSSKDYEQTINDTLDNTHIGKSIKEGRKQVLENGGVLSDAVIPETSIPVKKKGLQDVLDDGVVTGYTGTVGWDIPQTWDDVIGGVLPFPSVVGGTGAIGVPRTSPGVRVGENGESVEIPEDTVVSDPADEGDEDDEDPENPDKPIKDVVEEQGGTFFPSAMDLTNIFPFCIPFDVIYLVDMFDGKGEQAPVIRFPIVYPSAIRGVMGSDSYEVVIDFQDFVVVRNVLRVFLLLLFIAGLLKVTRDLIRG